MATEMATLYSSRPTTSSSATTCTRVFTKSPCAPVCRMVIMVEAGAVAAASAASTMEIAPSSPRTHFIRRYTSTEAMQASSTVMTITFRPFFFSTDTRKNSPVEKAIKARAISDRKSMPETISPGMAFRQ